MSAEDHTNSRPEDGAEACGVGEAGIGRRAARGFVSMTFVQLVRFAILTASMMVMSRLLTPRDFGLVAMVTAVIGVADMFRDMGLSTVTIQAKVLSRAQRDNLWWVNASIGAALSVAISMAAPLIALAYGVPELLMIALVSAPVFLINGMSTQYQANLQRDLRFGAIAAISISSQLLSASVGMIGAAMGAGYWAIIAQNLSGAVLGLFLVVRAGGWFPKRYTRGSGTWGHVKTGWQYFASAILFYVESNVDSIIIGKVFGPSALGGYNRAIQLVRVPLNLVSGAAGTVLVPAMSRVQESDEKLRRALRLQFIATGYPILLIVLVVLAIPEAVLSLAFGDQWVQVAPVLAWLAVGAGVSRLISGVAGGLTARGLARSLARLSLLNAAMTVVIVIFGSFFGVTVIAAGVSIYIAVTWPLGLLILHRRTGLKVSDVFATGFRLEVAGVAGWAIGKVCESVLPSAPWAQAICAGAGAAIFLCFLAVIPSYRRDMMEGIKVLRHLCRRS